MSDILPARVTDQQGFVTWFTGLLGAGKATLAHHIEKELRSRGWLVEILDGDVMRKHLGPELGFLKADRDANIRRIGDVVTF